MKKNAVIETFLLSAGLALLAGCGQQPPSPSKPVAEIKGAPINSPVATPAVPAAATAAVATTPEAPAAAAAAPVAQAAPAPTPAAAAPAAVEKDGDYFKVGFDRLAAFTYEMPDESTVSTNKIVEVALEKDQIPANVRAWDKKQVALKGFMLPLKVEGGLITELLIMRDQSMCCYGAVPRINEWVSVKMTGKGLKPIMDQAITLYGTLHVGEIRENGYLVGIYALDGEKMAGPLDL